MVIKTLLSSTDPIIEQEDGYSLDEENERFLGNLLDKTCSNEHTLLKYMSWMVIKTLFGKNFLLKVIVMSFESCKIMQIMHKSINIVTGSENHEKLCVRHVGVHLNS